MEQLRGGTKDRLIKWKGRVFCWQRNVIYEINTSTDQWTSVHTCSNFDTTDTYSRHTGLYEAEDSTGPVLIGFYAQVSNGGIRIVKTSDGSSWSDANITALNHMRSPTEIGRYRNVLFGTCQNTANWWSYDPINGIFSNGSLVGNHEGCSFSAFEGEFYMVYHVSTAGGLLKIDRYSGGTWATCISYVGEGSSGTYALEADQQQTELFVWGGALYLFCSGFIYPESQNGLRVFKYTTTNGIITEGNEVDLMNTVVPSEYRAGSTNRNISYSIVKAIPDYDTNPTSPSLYLVWIKDSSLSWLGLTWNGDSSLMTDEGTITSYGMAFGSSKDGGGGRIWTEDSIAIQLTGLDVGSGGLTIKFKAYGDSGSSDKTVKFYYSTDEGPPTSQCTLTGSPTGGSATRNGNQIENVNADDGTTEYTALWDFLTDGGFIGGKATVKARIEE